MQVGFNTRHEMSSWNTYLNFTNLDHRELKEWRQRWRQGYHKFAYLATRNRSFARFVATVLVLSTESLRNDDSSGNDNTTNQWFDWLNDEK